MVNRNYVGRSIDILFNILIVYYFCFALLDGGSDIESFGVKYFILILPIVAFSFYGVVYYLSSGANTGYTVGKTVSFIIIFIVSLLAVTLLRLDILGAVSGLIFGLVVFVILQNEVKLSVRLVNFLYIFAILFSVPAHYYGLNPYGFIPGMSGVGHNIEQLDGRISLFQNVALSIQFSFLILMINLFHGSSNWRWLLIVISFYYIYFGVSRLMLGIICIFIVISLVRKVIRFNNNRFYSDIVPLFLVLLTIGILLWFEYFTSFFLDIDFFASYFFRGFDDAQDILNDLARFDIWASHFEIFINNPLGVSSLEHIAIASQMNSGFLGSESFITRIFVVYGFSGFFFLLFIYSSIRSSVVTGNFFGYLMSLALIIVGFFYGSFYNVYNIIFLILISSLTLKKIDRALGLDNDNIRRRVRIV